MATVANFFNLKLIPIYILELFWITLIYGTVAFILAFFINGYILPPYNAENIHKTATWQLYFEIILQLTFQSFLVIIIIIILQKIPSPIDYFTSYSSKSPEGLVLRDPAILTVLLYVLSTSTQGRIVDLFSRFNKDALANLYI